VNVLKNNVSIHGAVCALLFAFALPPLFGEPPEVKNWKLVWEDDFNYPDAQLDKEWVSQNKASSHILCSRWRENAVANNGVLKLIAKKEQRGGQDWTAGNIWTKKRFQYGYFECRYKYAAAEGTNNSFWIMTDRGETLPQDKKHFEIDINEGHYPDEINTNFHNWSDFWIDKKTGKQMHAHDQRHIPMIAREERPAVSFVFEKPAKASKIRLTTHCFFRFHLREIRAFGVSEDGRYPDIKIKNDKSSPSFERIVNYAEGSKVSNSALNSQYPLNGVEKAVDGDPATSWITAQDSWLTAQEGGKFIEIDFGQERQLGCIQFLTGWLSAGAKKYADSIDNYKLEVFTDGEWKTVDTFAEDERRDIDLSAQYHLYGLEWNESELIFYFDGKEIDRRPNTVAHWPAPVWLSLALLRYGGRITDAIDGTCMDIDYVKIWQEEGKEIVTTERGGVKK